MNQDENQTKLITSRKNKAGRIVLTVLPRTKLYAQLFNISSNNHTSCRKKSMRFRDYFEQSTI